MSVLRWDCKGWTVTELVFRPLQVRLECPGNPWPGSCSHRAGLLSVLLQTL